MKGSDTVDFEGARNWLPGWSYRRGRTINYSAGAGTNYQKRVRAHYGTLDWTSFLKSLTFEKDTNNPLLSPNGAWEGTINICDEEIIEEADELRMYYTGHAEGATSGIGLATSPKTYPPTIWTRDPGNPIYQDGTFIRVGSMLKVDSTYYMYYQYGTAGQEIRLATSADGKSFTLVGTVLAPSGDETTVEDAAVVNIDATHWYMYYSYRTAGATLPGIRVATSADGESWSKVGDILSIGAAGTWDDTYIEHHQIMYVYDHYVLVYEAYDGARWACGMAYGTDPIAAFTKFAGNPIITRSGISGAFDEHQVATPFLFLHNDVWYLFFVGGDNASYGSAVWKISMAYNSENVYLNSKCRTDFGDIRFTDGFGNTPLDYWMEFEADSDNALFWVEIADDLSSLNRMIYIYYGKSDATSTSSGANTFVFFDDFPGTSLDAQWGSSQSVTVSSGQAHFTIGTDLVAGTESYIMSTATSSINKCLEVYFKPSAVGTQARLGWTVNRTHFASGAWNLIGSQFYGFMYTDTNDGSASPVQVNQASFAAEWQKLAIKWFSGNAIYHRNRTILWGGEDSQVPTGSDMKILMRDIMDVDWIFVRNAINLEPNGCEWRDEENVALFNVFNAGSVGAGYWTNPENAYSDNGIYATMVGLHANGYGGNIWKTFGITNPGGSATILKVEINAQWKLSTVVYNDHIDTAVSWDNGANWSPDYPDARDLSEDTDFWTDVTSVIAWTWDKLSDANLCVRVTATHGKDGAITFYLDVVQVRVTYVKPKASEKGDDSVAFETPKAGARF